MKKIFVIRGPGNTGKTSIIQSVYHQLIDCYPDADITDFQPGAYDVKAIISVNGKKLGIESHGDPNSRLKDSLHEFAQFDCNTILCATRTRGMTVEWVKSYHPPYEIEYFDQRYFDKHKRDQKNAELAQSVFEKVSVELANDDLPF